MSVTQGSIRGCILPYRGSIGESLKVCGLMNGKNSKEFDFMYLLLKIKLDVCIQFFQFRVLPLEVCIHNVVNDGIPPVVVIVKCKGNHNIRVERTNRHIEEKI
jgi:hypothetical protein